MVVRWVGVPAPHLFTHTTPAREGTPVGHGAMWPPCGVSTSPAAREAVVVGRGGGMGGWVCGGVCGASKLHPAARFLPLPCGGHRLKPFLYFWKEVETSRWCKWSTTIQHSL